MTGIDPLHLSDPTFTGEPHWWAFTIRKLREVQSLEDVDLSAEIAPGLTLEEAIGGIATAHRALGDLADDLTLLRDRPEVAEEWRERLSLMGYKRRR